MLYINQKIKTAVFFCFMIVSGIFSLIEYWSVGLKEFFPIIFPPKRIIAAAGV